MEFRQWTHSNLCRMYFSQGDYAHAAEHAREMTALSSWDTARDELVSVSCLCLCVHGLLFV